MAGTSTGSSSLWFGFNGFQPGTNFPDHHCTDVEPGISTDSYERDWFSCEPGQYGSGSISVVGRQRGSAYWYVVVVALCCCSYDCNVGLVGRFAEEASVGTGEHECIRRV